MDFMSQASIEQEAGACLLERYWKWFTWPVIWAEILLWAQDNREHYLDDTTGERQLADMYAAVAARLEHFKAKKIGYVVDDLAWYSIPELKELVEQVCSGQNATRIDAAYADVEYGLYKLMPAKARHVIIGYHAGWITDEVAYDQAVQALQTALGSQKPDGL